MTTNSGTSGDGDRLRVLIVDDEEDLRSLVGTALRFEGMDTHAVANGTTALATLQREHFDVVVLDVMLPDQDGFEVLRRIRKLPSSPPVLFLTARDDVDDRIRGLTQGADDYLGKPFSVGELVARVNVVARRNVKETTSVAVGDLLIEPDAARVVRAGTEIELTPTEFKLLLTLAQHAGNVLSKAQLLETVWGWDFDGDANVVETYISYLRRKVDSGDDKMIRTVRGFGYTLRADDPHHR